MRQRPPQPPTSQHLHVTSHCTAGICCLLCRRAKRTLLNVNCQRLVLVWKRGTGSLFILLVCARLMAIWCRRGLVMKPLCSQGDETLSEPLNAARCLWLASVATEDEKRWESRSKENLLAGTPWCAFTKCQCSQPSCFLSVCLCASAASSVQPGNSFQL